MFTHVYFSNPTDQTRPTKTKARSQSARTALTHLATTMTMLGGGNGCACGRWPLLFLAWAQWLRGHTRLLPPQHHRIAKWLSTATDPLSQSTFPPLTHPSHTPRTPNINLEQAHPHTLPRATPRHVTLALQRSQASSQLGKKER